MPGKRSTWLEVGLELGLVSGFVLVLGFGLVLGFALVLVLGLGLGYSMPRGSGRPPAVR